MARCAGRCPAVVGLRFIRTENSGEHDLQYIHLKNVIYNVFFYRISTMNMYTLLFSVDFHRSWQSNRVVPVSLFRFSYILTLIKNTKIDDLSTIYINLL